jgi:hypothetical protein
MWKEIKMETQALTPWFMCKWREYLRNAPQIQRMTAETELDISEREPWQIASRSDLYEFGGREHECGRVKV